MAPDEGETQTMAKGLTKADVLKKAEELKNWGKWGPDDQLGVLNYITPEDIANAAKLVKKGKVFRLGLELDEKGPQRGLFGGRWNPMHQMLATGTDAVQGIQEPLVGMRYADDAINLPTQAATQWDALAHVFLGDQMWNGYPATLVDTRGAVSSDADVQHAVRPARHDVSPTPCHAGVRSTRRCQLSLA